MPHSVPLEPSPAHEGSVNRSSGGKSPADRNGESGHGTEKFPDFDIGAPIGRPASPPRPNQHAGSNNHTNGSAFPADRWQPRRNSRVRWTQNEPPLQTLGHDRPRRISNAIRHIRSGSMSQNAHELAGALRAPVSYRLIMLCLMWYWSSALTNTSSKSILTAFDKPATLTLVQFAFVSSYCILCSWLASTFPRIRSAIPALKHPIRYPSRDVIVTTLPLAAFQIVGHLLSSTATSQIPVSLVHTIKGLSPLFTVLAYRLIFNIRYPRATYLSLVPLTAGVMLACSGNHTFRGEFLGILYALLATIIFVTQNIFSKRLFNEAAFAEEQGRGAQSRKLDKLNLLCYSSGLAFLITGPIWFWTEGLGILGDFLWDGSVDLRQSPNSFDHGRLTVEFIFNGSFHFGQNILAFVLLSMVSPVTYSVASLTKRVFVIIVAILWFRSPTTNVQAAGIALTFVGLYLYDRSNEKNKADQRARTMTDVGGERPLLPLDVKRALASGGGGGGSSQAPAVFESPAPMGQSPHPYTNAYLYAGGEDSKKSDDLGRARNGGNGGNVGGGGGGGSAWLPPGTKQEETWRAADATPVPA